MGTNTTEPSTQISTAVDHPICEQRAAAEALVALMVMQGALPGGYIKIHQGCYSSAWLAIQFQTPNAFELWREALGIPGSAVSLHAPSDEYVWLDAKTTFRGVKVELTGFGVPLTAEQANTPQAADETPAVAA